jgi:hypothetical protein
LTAPYRLPGIQEGHASYLCIDEAAGGIQYNAQTRKWEGTAFRAFQKFILRMKFLKTRVAGQEETVFDYSVTINKMGSSYAAPCVHPSEDPRAREPTHRVGACGGERRQEMTRLLERRISRLERDTHVGPDVDRANAIQVPVGVNLR